MTALTVSRYVPAGSVKVADKLSDAVAYAYERGGKFCVVLYAGRAQKAAAHWSFRDQSTREKNVIAFFESRRERMAYKAQKREAASNDGVKLGQVYVASWGYEQTNVNFYEVVELVGKGSVKLCEVAAMECSGNWGERYGDRGYCEPSDSANRRLGETFTAKVRNNGDYVVSAKIAGRDSAHRWNGKPQYHSSYH